MQTRAADAPQEQPPDISADSDSEPVGRDGDSGDDGAVASGLPMPVWLAVMILVVLAHQGIAAMMR